MGQIQSRMARKVSSQLTRYSAATSECPVELQRGFPAHYSYLASGHQRRWQQPEKQAGITRSRDADGHASNGDAPNSGGRVRKAAIISRRKPTPRQRARWKAVQRAKLNGLSIRGIARELGIHRDTARRYMAAESPPMMRPRVKSGASLAPAFAEEATKLSERLEFRRVPQHDQDVIVRKSAHCCISVRRCSSRSDRIYACSTDEPTVWARESSTAAWEADVHSAAHTRKEERKPCTVARSCSPTRFSTSVSVFSLRGAPGRSGDGRRPSPIRHLCFLRALAPQSWRC